MSYKPLALPFLDHEKGLLGVFSLFKPVIQHLMRLTLSGRSSLVQKCYVGLRNFFDVFIGRKVSKGWPRRKRKVAPRLVSMSSRKSGSANYHGSVPRWSSRRMGIADYFVYRPKWSSHQKSLLSLVRPQAGSTPWISSLG